MPNKPIFVGVNKFSKEPKKASGNFVQIENETYYKIANVNAMRPFFMSIISDSNHWMFIGSNGGLSAGRKDADTAFFPYYTDDKIIEFAEITGSKTIIKIKLKEKILLWEPFSNKYEGCYTVIRNIYKNKLGNKIIFEEINNELSLTYQYQWSSSNRFGFVKKASLINTSSKKIEVTVLDGFQNIIPFGVGAELQNSKSNLVDAYKKSELEKETGLGIFALSAIIVDKAEPSEALKTSVAWSIGFKNPTYLISSLQLDAFRYDEKITSEIDVRAEKGAYFTISDFSLKASEEKNWFFGANVNQGPSAVNFLNESLKTPIKLLNEVLSDIKLCDKNLLELAITADGLQLTNDELVTTRHYANVLFNCMRGGIFDDNYQIDKGDFINYLKKANSKLYDEKEILFKNFPAVFSLNKLRELANNQLDTNFKRLCFEYLPLKFSRRHGDPSRPWNKFSINTRSEVDGSKILNYEGNWRDIFQNWEALAHSYPEFIEGMLFKFLNASTFDGYNPYRVTKDGIDWEVIEPHDPWSFIGYWGDHQVIYLLKFLEFLENYYPKKIEHYLHQDIFVYANVPSKIKSYSEILKNPKDTILFDDELDHEIRKRKKQLGADGALLTSKNNVIYQVNLLEKLLAVVLAKCSNFVPEAGIWMNTQRPEWNDANNALVGNGTSMVTLYYLTRFLNFFKANIQKTTINSIAISEEMLQFFDEISKTFINYTNLLKDKISDENRKTIVDSLGTAGSNFRTKIYKEGFSGNKEKISKTQLLQFIESTLAHLHHAITAGKRNDNLYHSYNLITIKNSNEIEVSHLTEMLEGQVSVLSSGFISSEESAKLLDSLRESKLYRKDQNSYILYPNKDLGRFIAKNCIPKTSFQKSKLLQKLVQDGNSQIIEKDVLGIYHFNGNFNNVGSLKDALNQLDSSYKNLLEKEQKLIENIFEEVFNHKYFTGRSGTFFGYEGLGSIYWHMVSKLSLAVQETYFKAVEKNDESEVISKLAHYYHEINEGIGVHKSPQVYGAFPIDPYSHTPAHKGAQQPGMTGQVKEDILTRMGELGVFVKNGKVHFKPTLLRKNEFLQTEQSILFKTINNEEKLLKLEKNSLLFSFCQTPIIYKLSKKNSVEVTLSNKQSVELTELALTENLSQQLFKRTGEIEQIKVFLNKNRFVN